jgi:hypothetical protein
VLRGSLWMLPKVRVVDEGLELVLAVLLHFKFLLLGCQLKRQNIR